MNLKFICIGASHAGIGILEKILKSHPGVLIFEEGKVEYFKENISKKKVKKIDLLKSRYPQSNSIEITGVIEPNLHLKKKNIERISKVFGDEVKILFIVRDPADRAYSHYLASCRSGFEKLSFMDAIKSESHWLKNPSQYEGAPINFYGHLDKNHFGYIYRSNYYKPLKTLYTSYANDQIKVMNYEDIERGDEEVLSSLFSFLGIEYSKSLLANSKQSCIATKLKALKNYFNKPDKLSEEARSYLYYTYFKSNIDKTENLLDRSFKDWKVV